MLKYKEVDNIKYIIFFNSFGKTYFMEVLMSEN